MNVTTVLDFLAEKECFQIDYREVVSSGFGMLRRYLRGILNALSEDGNEYDMEPVLKLRQKLLEWLTVPVAFDDRLTESLYLLGQPEYVERHWGCDVGREYGFALEIAGLLKKCGNPLRSLISDEINELFRRGMNFRIHAHERSREHFRSISSDLCDSHFVYNHHDYDNSQPFDVLIKVGPLRSAGWGKCPDALLTSPRFSTLTQFVWAGLPDEQGFGLDPVTGQSVVDVLAGRQSMSPMGLVGELKWAVTSRRTADICPVETNVDGIDDEGDAKVDDFSLMAAIRTRYLGPNEEHSAVLLSFFTGYGVLLPARGKIMVYDPDGCGGNKILEWRAPFDRRNEGCFYVHPDIGDADFGALHVDKNAYSKIWKRCLSDVPSWHFEDLCSDLVREGIKLQNIQYRIREWANPPETVIFAPQRWEHFRVLISVLSHYCKENILQGDDFASEAWKEIQRSRGNAIAEGREEHTVQREMEFSLLKELLSGNMLIDSSLNEAKMTIPNDGDLQGSYRFFRVDDIKKGLLVPMSLMRKIKLIKEFDVWQE